MILEKQIEEVMSNFEDENFEDSFAIDEPVYWHYLNSENFTGLSEKEHKLLYFINSVIYHTAFANDLEFDLESFELVEEENWTIRENNKSWSDTKNVFFENYPEEDLLAFVEDMLADDDEDNISEISQEIIFITAKSYIDLLIT